MNAVRADALIEESRRAARPHTPARTDIWPPRERYGLSRLELSAVRPSSADDVLGRLVDRLMAIADATWALHRGGVDAPVAELELLAAGAGTMRLLGAAMGGDLQHFMAERADAVARQDWDTNARLTAGCDDHRLVALYGPLHTWSNKGDGFGFSAAVGVRDDKADAFARRVEGTIFSAADPVGRATGGQPFELVHVPAYVITDLVGCGGEANTFPKHFAYFMPEDGRVPDRDKTMTVVFRNVYTQQFREVSAPVAAAVCEGWTDLDADRVERALLTWLRGHDISHFLTEGGAVPDHLGGWPGFVRGTLQETFADVVGFLLAGTPSTTEVADLTVDDLGQAFMGEVLRYFRRGWGWFPDSCAAQLELAYLVDAGWLHVELPAGGPPVLQWEAKSLHEGLRELGELLVLALLRGDVGAKDCLRAYCVEPRPAWLAQFEAGLLDATAHVPDGLYYTFLP
ncbi:MAG: hypothetical protein KY395_00330 [Actinobacteria bacterium]|nr:hypothetical protein [Actinomycetota bacterium]